MDLDEKIKNKHIDLYECVQLLCLDSRRLLADVCTLLSAILASHKFVMWSLVTDTFTLDPTSYMLSRYYISNWQT